MEAALAADIPTYSGGLGVLAGDTLRSMADLGVPSVGVTLLHRRGYFKQTLDAQGRQGTDEQPWPHPPKEDPRVREVRLGATVQIEGRQVALRVWRYDVTGRGDAGGVVPVYLLDTDVETNDPWDRRITDRLYGGDDRYRLAQEIVLGVGGVRVLELLELPIRRHHLNEGHAALAVAELWRRLRDVGEVRRRCAFTTHTPVPAGHDMFDRDLTAAMLPADVLASVAEVAPAFGAGGPLDMTRLALQGSDWANGVAWKHGEVSRGMFPEHAERIHAVTNGVHAATWVCPQMGAVYDAHLPGWRQDPCALRNARGRIPGQALLSAHHEAKVALWAEVGRRVGPERAAGLRPEALTLGFARRATAYKRLDLLFRDPARLAAVGAQGPAPLQILLAGKAHPKDLEGQALIRRVYELSEGEALRTAGVQVLYLPGYDMDLGAKLTSGVDVWLNTPRPPREASGTSGMKAALNGVPNLSTLDGWWIEGHQEGVTGWAIDDPGDDDRAAESLYEKLERAVLPAHASPRRWAGLMAGAIADNGAWFHTHRMVKDYVAAAWLR